MAGKNQHVVPRGNEWAVRGAGNERATSIHPTQADAERAAREIAINQQSEVVIHRPGWSDSRQKLVRARPVSSEGLIR